MAEDSDMERTEPATGKRIERAREQGDVPRSRELATTLMLLVGGSCVWLFSGPVVTALDRIMVATLTFERAAAFDPALLFDMLSAHMLDVAVSMIPLAFLMTLAAMAAPLMLGGWLFNVDSLAPKFSKLNPISGFANMFSINSLVELGKAVLKTLLVGTVAWIAIRSQLDAVMGLGVESLKTAGSHAAQLLWISFITMVSALILIAALDVPYQIWNYGRKLRMTREEVKQEHKESEGDPHIKGKIRAMQRAMARRRMMAEVPTADVVVTNPTHFAVALKYTEGKMGAPKVVAKGADDVAAKIRELAREHKVPLLEAPPLARALHAHTEIGDEIPEALYTAVAEVLAYVFQLRTFGQFGGNRPVEPTELNVPKDLDPATAPKKPRGPKNRNRQ
ncbi:flagellar biosynthesis protein FlhB [Herbaspirillum huttiense]|jgi:flagellar biosynthetic protein FlhB|uniref:Flagellar biosynthetic protein FlhB n=1 Tax=Herbaspirillum huttiense subsp. lycopersici TaxID=3074428 RepID=A0ABU2EGL2_9BURK|nr:MULTISPECIES: flagellar biosynthesis protein FlhB [Herbaspirillum]MBN9358505.1 flagellar type III secretion system protein FlhB [Herbaspirillum huttiense]MBP1312943.1 flagellar biosynthetic protein FlhB [Herbaspirillum sp. 1130]MCO4856813.1 flagellar type III secretion system protein FlhB [Herbaspirillum sp. WGmk3]MCP3655042.1 flagellar type III secretion system protein FlhB [Herbaspirillum sp.]MCP3945779.1 flagellar type III secretion system protein FlhB [Herbaspirillum sp.]